MIHSQYGLAWLAARGKNVNNNINDGFTAYLQTKTGTAINKNSMLYNLLGSLGYTQPGLNDRLIAIWAAKTGLPATTPFNSLEVAFYSNTANDYI